MDNHHFYVQLKRMNNHFSSSYPFESFKKIQKLFMDLPDKAITDFVDFALLNYVKHPTLEHIEDWINRNYPNQQQKAKEERKISIKSQNHIALEYLKSLPSEKDNSVKDACLALLEAKITGKISKKEFYKYLDSLENAVSAPCSCNDGKVYIDNKLYACRKCTRGKEIHDKPLKFEKRDGTIQEVQVAYAPVDFPLKD